MLGNYCCFCAEIVDVDDAGNGDMDFHQTCYEDKTRPAPTLLSVDDVFSRADGLNPAKPVMDKVNELIQYVTA